MRYNIIKKTLPKGEAVQSESKKSERNTHQKQTVREVFASLRNHPTAEMVCAEVARRDPRIGRATVYRILNALVESGQAIKVPVYDGADRFDITVVPHSHAKCRLCGAVVDVETCGALPPLCEGSGFLAEGGAVLYYGVCRECSNKRNNN